MSSNESVTQWIDDLKHGDSQAAQQLWQRYYKQLLKLARDKLDQTPRRMADEEDVLVQAFASFCRGVDDDRFPRLDDRDDLWQVLVMLIERKAIDQMRRESARKRGGRAAGRAPVNVQRETLGAAHAIAKEPTPELAAQLLERLEVLLDVLGDQELRKIALDKLDGYTNKEISNRVGTSLRSVERRLELIRTIWRHELGVDHG